MLFAQTTFCYCHDTTTQSNSRRFCAKSKFGLLVVNPHYALTLWHSLSLNGLGSFKPSSEDFLYFNLIEASQTLEPSYNPVWELGFVYRMIFLCHCETTSILSQLAHSLTSSSSNTRVPGQPAALTPKLRGLLQYERTSTLQLHCRLPQRQLQSWKNI